MKYAIVHKETDVIVVLEQTDPSAIASHKKALIVLVPSVVVDIGHDIRLFGVKKEEPIQIIGGVTTLAELIKQNPSWLKYEWDDVAANGSSGLAYCTDESDVDFITTHRIRSLMASGDDKFSQIDGQLKLLRTALKAMAILMEPARYDTDVVETARQTLDQAIEFDDLIELIRSDGKRLKQQLRGE